MTPGKKIYFASDFHLGLGTPEETKKRESLLVKWLDTIKSDAQEVFLVGDLFDVWFEYKRVVPKGHVRFLAKIAELVEAGIPVHVFTGNHDMWMFNYFEKELGVKMYRKPVARQFNGKHFFIGHGDGLGPGDRGYKFIKRIFGSKFCQWLYARFHPNFGIWLATYFSRKGANKRENENQYKGDEREYLVQFCNQHLKEFQIDYFVFGHRHLPLTKQIQNATYVNLGDWVKYNSYAVFDGTTLELKYFNN